MHTPQLFKPATRHKTKLRMAIDGPPGSGKTYTALRLAFALGRRVALIDTEHGSAAKYAGEAPDGTPFVFDVLELHEFGPAVYENATKAAGEAGYDVLIIDSLSHAWAGTGGALEMVDRAAASKTRGNTFTAWKDVTPQHNRMVEAILRCPCHVIVTMRTKMEYVLETDERGKQVPRKVGLGPVQRAGVEYEFDIVADLDHAHTLTVSKSRCSAIDGRVVTKPDAGFMGHVIRWLNDGADAARESLDAAGVGFAPPPAAGQGTSAANGVTAGPVDVRELARRRAAGNTDSPKTASSPQAETVDLPPATDPHEQFDSDPLTSEQLAELVALRDRLQIPAPVWHGKILAKRGVATARNLNGRQAQELIANLQAKVTEREADELFGEAADEPQREPPQEPAKN